MIERGVALHCVKITLTPVPLQTFFAGHISKCTLSFSSIKLSYIKIHWYNFLLISRVIENIDSKNWQYERRQIRSELAAYE